MLGLEAACVAIVALFVGVRAARDPEPFVFVRRLLLLVAGAWIGENTVIHVYGFYHYDPRWSLFVDRVPLMIVCIWPVVIHSAWDLSGYILRGEQTSVRRVALMGCALVLADASLIEPIAVNSQLWYWTQPGLFEVPPIGIAGWAFFAGLCMAIFESNRRRGRSGLADLAVLVLAPLGTHVLLLATWWGALRWLNHTVPPWPAVAVAWVVSLTLLMRVLNGRLYDRVPSIEMLLRVPAAAFFFVLLILDAEQPALVAYALAFAPPYLALTRAQPGGIQ